MEYRHLGRTGLRVSELSYGTWVTFSNQLNAEEARACLAAAYEGGVNFFDCAEVYAGGRAEEILGEALKKLSWRRSSYLISTKFYWGLNEGINEKNTLNRKRLLEGIRGSLRRLQHEYVDLIFCHRPDPTTPIEETVWAMHDIVERGQAVYWGTSQWPAAEIVAAIETAERHHLHKPVMEQPLYNLFRRERFEHEYASLFRRYGYGSTTWSRATLKGYDWLHERVTDPDRLEKVRALAPIAKEAGCSLAQLSIAWILKNPNVSTVITGASNVKQVQENLGASAVAARLTPELVEKIEAVFGTASNDDED
jgi:voltage-dependent potassium channel beta subunit